VLFEIFTGRRAYDAKSLQELRALQESGALTTPSSVVRDLDPAIERAILRCLERDPQRRPGSALAVAAALPGGDPVAAALAAGETPSPEMLIAAGESEAWPLARAVTAAVVFLASIAAFVLFSSGASVASLVPLEKPTDVLVDRAQQIIGALGYTDKAADRAYGFSAPSDYPGWVSRTSRDSNWWPALASGAPPALTFWYRDSPRDLASQRISVGIAPSDPPADVPGMRGLVLDSEGRLQQFHAVPPEVDAASTPAPAPDWKALFDAAGQNLSAFTSVAPEWTPRDFADTRAAWEGPLAGRPDLRVRVEAAAYRGRPVSFSIVGPWTQPAHMTTTPRTAPQGAVMALIVLVSVVSLVGASLLARYNLRANRADRRGASRLALGLLVAGVVAWLAANHHVAAADLEFGTFIRVLMSAGFNAATLWVLYLALEPYARRFWPDGLLGWTRFLSGRVVDPRVGRDVLVGALMGAAIVMVELAHAVVPPMLGVKADLPPFGRAIYALNGTAMTLVQWVEAVYGSLQTALFVALVFVVFRLLLRRGWLAVTAGVLLITLVSNNGAAANGGWMLIVFQLAVTALMTVSVFRFGLLTTSVALIVDNTVTAVPLSLHPSAWWATGSNLTLAAMVALAAYGFYAARAGRPLFGTLASAD